MLDASMFKKPGPNIKFLLRVMPWGMVKTFLETQIDQGSRACFVGARCGPIEGCQPCLKLPMKLTSCWKFSESASDVLCGHEHFDMALMKKVA